MNRARFSFATTKTTELVDITATIEKVAARERIQQGEVSLFLLHSTAALTTSAFNPSQDIDVLSAIETIVPSKYKELRMHSNLPLYIVASFLGQHLSIPVENGKLFLGGMQRIILVELNGPRERNIIVSWNA